MEILFEASFDRIRDKWSRRVVARYERNVIRQDCYGENSEVWRCTLFPVNDELESYADFAVIYGRLQSRTTGSSATDRSIETRGKMHRY